MSLKDSLVSDEIQSAYDAGGEMMRIVKQTSHFWLKLCVANLLPILLGSIGSYLILTSFVIPTDASQQQGIATIEADQLKNLSTVIGSGMTLISVLAGFTVTLMLFTGHTSNTKSLTADTVQLYAGKVTYLLFSQALTLLVHVASIILSLLWMFLQSMHDDQLASPILLSITGGFLSLSLLRTILLPFQIYDVHHFELSALIDEKTQEFEEQLSERMKSRHQDS